ncbi:MAG: hypothetical protein ACP5C4_06940 [Methanomicrobiales archaeon]
MNQDAVAPVVAMMLIIAVLVTFLSIVNATIIPSYKQQAEVDHLHDVEEGILSFGSDLEMAAALGRPMRLSECIPLGGGNIILDPVRSGGTLQVRAEEQWIARIENESATLGFSNLSAFSYAPVSNFWQDQGYVWRFGCVNVTKGQTGLSVIGRQTPLQFATMQEAEKDMEKSGFPASLIHLEDTGAWTNTSSLNKSTWLHNCTHLEIKMVTFVPGERAFISGNGLGRLILDASVEDRNYQNQSRVSISVNRSLPLSFNRSLEGALEGSMRDLEKTYDNLEYNQREEHMDLTASPAEMDVTLRKVTVTVSAT